MQPRPSQEREDAARKLAAHHFEVEPELRLVVFLDIDPEDTITLLEISESTPASGSVEAFVFAPTKDVPYVTRIAEVTPEEYEELQRDPSRIRLPPAWDLTKAKFFRRQTS
ncbi:hypothetical protein ENSA5_65990 [Enhygromyxa salina]|uniref:Uncharacterized protein n=1 Tax=Enhygromyxa salina TaxID=215803 RepID=A0A2S9XBS1_9BACT|nr:hypothetical protein [Enhygromyxa salina]PRP90303.1 hypothetical protein ENSA5_65990 [Enhygromyxa salina]